MDDTTLRDYFAARAPQEVPDWFDHTRPPGRPDRFRNYEDEHPRPPHGFPTAAEYDAYEARKRAWWDNGGSDRYDAYEDALGKWKSADNLARLTQWAYAYADAMLEARRS